MDEYIDREELRQSFDLYKTGFEWFHDKATKAYKLLQEVVERYCVDLDSEEDTPPGEIPIHTNGDYLMEAIFEFLGLKDGDEAWKIGIGMEEV